MQSPSQHPDPKPHFPPAPLAGLTETLKASSRACARARVALAPAPVRRFTNEIDATHHGDAAELACSQAQGGKPAMPGAYGVCLGVRNVREQSIKCAEKAGRGMSAVAVC
jgi:hypothetical protein